MEESGSDDNRARRRALRGADRERLLRYVASILAHQNTPLRDIVRDRVLPLLPVQPLRRFLSVSRSWHAHLSSPFFAHTQSTAHRSLSGFFFDFSYYLPLDPRGATSIPDPAFSFLPDTVSVVASRNGLVACRSSIDPSRYYISNPATRDWTALPRTLLPAEISAAALVFQPTALDFSADYYLVCVSARPRLGLQVFSSGLSAWQPSNAAAAATINIPKAREPWSSVAVDGLAYWPNRDGSVSSYDPTADRLTVIAPPPVGTGRWELAEIGGKLCCVAARQGTVEVWSTTAGAAWRRLASVEMDGEPRPMASEGKEDRAVVCVGDRVVAIDVRSGEWRVVRDGFVTTDWDVCVPYVSSLVAVKEFCYGRGCYTCKLHRC